MFPRTEIEHLYTTFGKYSAVGMEHCPCGCVREEWVQLLFSKPLRELSEDDGLCYYHGKALFTWGDVPHYKHFLPRFLELYSQSRSLAQIDLGDIYHRLEYAHWQKWEPTEIEAIEN